MPPFTFPVIFIFIASVTYLGQIAQGRSVSYVQDACRVTHYRNLCIHSLSSFSNTAKRSPSRWARAGVSVTIGETKGVVQYLLKSKSYFKGRSRIALSDCIECFQSAIDELHRSLGILRTLSARDFYTQISDLTTFMSAALTDQGTCLDGFEGVRGKPAQALQNRVSNATYFTSNALALINKLAETGVDSLTEP